MIDIPSSPWISRRLAESLRIQRPATSTPTARLTSLSSLQEGCRIRRSRPAVAVWSTARSEGSHPPPTCAPEAATVLRGRPEDGVGYSGDWF
jgi:hypothetical protein